MVKHCVISPNGETNDKTDDDAEGEIDGEATS